MSDTKSLGGKIALRGADAAPHAFERLKQSFGGIDWGVEESKADAVINLSIDPGLKEGAFEISLEAPDQAPPALNISGGKLSGLIYGVEHLIRTGGSESDEIVVPRKGIKKTPGLAYRTFWTWDHSTNWEL
ncbi:MAG TPA: hypothetical protein ENJ90_01500, partial [Devosia sp.]|nr:hypothetical protein [Devosia sp.]